MTGRALLVVPLAGLVSVVPPLGRGPLAPHVTLVDPFPSGPEPDEGVVAELRGYFADVVPFEVTFTEVTRFPGGPAYLAPDPAAPFRRLNQGLLRLFPELPRRTDVVTGGPHLEVPQPTGASGGPVEDDLAPWLPVTTTVRATELWWTDADTSRVLAGFDFGTSAA